MCGSKKETASKYQAYNIICPSNNIVNSVSSDLAFRFLIWLGWVYWAIQGVKEQWNVNKCSKQIEAFQDVIQSNLYKKKLVCDVCMSENC